MIKENIAVSKKLINRKRLHCTFSRQVSSDFWEVWSLEKEGEKKWDEFRYWLAWWKNENLKSSGCSWIVVSAESRERKRTSEQY